MKEIVDKMITDQDFRRRTVFENHFWFFYFYFPSYIKCEMAPFHVDMFALTEDERIRMAIVVAFRGSAKSSIFGMSFPIWAILGKEQLKHVLLIASTQQKAQLLLQNIKYEFENNRVLQVDLGPFKEEQLPGWNATSLYLPKYEAKITIASIEQGIRGMRFKEHRPQLVIIDDMEDIESVKTKESRDKLENWLTGEVLPIGDISSRIIIVGNLLHNDSVVMRLKKRMAENLMNGTYMEIPLIDNSGNITWPGKYPNMEAIETERKRGYSEIAWQREMMLKIISDESQIVKEEDIHYYDILPTLDSFTDYRFTITSIDPAISLKETADCTAMLSAHIFKKGKDRKIYLLPDIVNERLESTELLKRAEIISKTLGNGIPTRVIVEDVGSQRAYPQLLIERGIPAESVPIYGNDKRSRLMMTSPLIKMGNIIFPKKGCEDLLIQLFGFGTEKHDDIVDALTLLVLKLIKDDSDENPLVIPGPYNSELIETLPVKELEKEADELEMLKQNAIKSGDRIMLQKYYSSHNKRLQQNSRERWKKEETFFFNKMNSRR